MLWISHWLEYPFKTAEGIECQWHNTAKYANEQTSTPDQTLQKYRVNVIWANLRVGSHNAASNCYNCYSYYISRTCPRDLRLPLNEATRVVHLFYSWLFYGLKCETDSYNYLEECVNSEWSCVLRAAFWIEMCIHHILQDLRRLPPR